MNEWEKNHQIIWVEWSKCQKRGQLYLNCIRRDRMKSGLTWCIMKESYLWWMQIYWEYDWLWGSYISLWVGWTFGYGCCFWLGHRQIMMIHWLLDWWLCYWGLLVDYHWRLIIGSFHKRWKGYWLICIDQLSWFIWY